MAKSHSPSSFSFTTVTTEMPERGYHQGSLAYSQAVPRARVQSSSPKIEISINILNGQAFSVLMDSTDTVVRLKEKIQETVYYQDNIDIPPEDQQLVFGGKKLKDDQTMSDVGVSKNCVIFCVHKKTHLGGSVVDKRVLPDLSPILAVASPARRSSSGSARGRYKVSSRRPKKCCCLI